MGQDLGVDERWDRQALQAGGAVSLVFAVPFSIGARLAADADNEALALWLSLGALGGFTLGAGCAAWVQRVRLPFSHALVSALVTYFAAQAVFVVIKLLRGGEVNWFGVLFTGSAVAGAAMIGGWLGNRLHRKGIRPSMTAGR